MAWLDAVRQFDFQLFELVNGWAGRWEWLDVLGIFSSEYLIFVIGLLVLWVAVRSTKRTVAGIVLPSARNWFFPSGMPSRPEKVSSAGREGRSFSGAMMAASACIAAGSGYVVRKFIGEYLGRVRPFSRAIEVTHLSLNLSDGSFPSGHATVAFALAFSVLFTRPGWGLFLVVLALLVSMGRVFAGVHYPGDVAAGMGLGLLSACISRFIIQFAVRVYNAKFKMQNSKLQSKM